MTEAVRSVGPSVAMPPVAAREPLATTVHGATRVDDYAWLRRRDDPAVLAYLEAENAYADAVLKPEEPLQRALYDEMLSHIKQTDVSVPYADGGWWYYTRTEEGAQYPIFARKRGSLDAPEAILLDLNVLAAGHPYLGLGDFAVSDDGTLLAYSLDRTGYRQYTLYVRDLRTNADLPLAIERVASVTWGADHRTLFYVSEDEQSKRRDTFWRHELGTAEHDVLYREADEHFDLDVSRTRDRCYVLLVAYSKATTETRIVPADRPLEPPAVVVPRSDGHRYAVEHRDGTFYIVTNRGADDFRIVSAPAATPGEAHWRELVPERTGVYVDELDVFRRFAVVRERRDGFPNLSLLDLETGTLRAVALPEDAHALGSAMNPDFDATAYRFTYQSLVTPNSAFELDPRDLSLSLLKQTEVPGYDPSLYASELRHATARDGVAIPISLVFRIGRKHDGTEPLLLYGYGSYGVSVDPAFSPARLALLDRGVAYAIAHVRGGGELGEAWRTAGHLQRKRTTFSDFIACAEHLIATRETRPDRLAIQGGSAGGLLVAAVANERPDLFGAVVAQVPFVDVANTMLDASLPLTTSEYLEWGDPRRPDDFAYLLSYSPYDNVGARA